MQRAQDRSHDGKCADTIEQAGRNEALCKTVTAPFRQGPFHPTVQIQGRADESADGQRKDEQDREFAFGHVGHERVRPQGERGKAHRIEQGTRVLFPEPLLEQGPDQGADDDAARIDNSPKHFRLQR